MKVLPFTLLLQEPVLATAPGGDPNTDESERFIPGSAVRGALAGRYWKTYDRNNNEDKARFNHLFLNGPNCFLNAYPVGKTWSRALPPPRHWATLKDGGNKIYNLASDSIPKDGIPQPVKKAFIEVLDKKAIPLRIDYEVAVHNARNKEKGRAIPNDPTNQSALFSYKALAAGQRFTGAIVVEDEDADDVAVLQALFTPDEMLLGGSRSAGYGLTQIEKVGEASDWTAWREAAFGKVVDIAAGEAFVVYLSSDTVLRDPETGQETTDMLAILQERLPNHSIERASDVYSFASMGWVGGFNQHWGLPLPQTWATLRGSVWILRANKPLTAKDITALEQSGVGERRAEGFGRLIFNPNWLDKAELLAEPSENMREREENGRELSAASQKLIDQMNERIMRRDLDRFVVEAAQKNAKKSRGSLSGSQLARLRLQARNGLTAFGKYLAGTHERKSADDQFRKFVVNGRNFRETLEKLAQEPGQVWELILKGHQLPPTIGDYPSPRHNLELTQYYAVRYIDAVCEQLAKKGGN